MYRHTPTRLKRPVPRNRLGWLFARTERPLTETSPRPDEVRLDLVARVRAAIAAGVYETHEKWEAALNRLARRLE
jgi:hypothetical protein